MMHSPLNPVINETAAILLNEISLDNRIAPEVTSKIPTRTPHIFCG